MAIIKLRRSSVADTLELLTMWRNCNSQLYWIQLEQKIANFLPNDLNVELSQDLASQLAWRSSITKDSEIQLAPAVQKIFRSWKEETNERLAKFWRCKRLVKLAALSLIAASESVLKKETAVFWWNILYSEPTTVQDSIIQGIIDTLRD